MMREEQQLRRRMSICGDASLYSTASDKGMYELQAKEDEVWRPMPLHPLPRQRSLDVQSPKLLARLFADDE